MSPDPSITVRAATEDEADPIRSIYNHYVTNSVATFDLAERTLDDQRRYLRDRSGAWGVLVATDGDDILGFASLSPYKERAAYRTTVENSIYLHPDATGRGVGRLLLNELISMARSHGFHSVIARVNASMDASIAVHKSVGYESVGVEREVGRKFGRWQDVHILQLIL